MYPPWKLTQEYPQCHHSAHFKPRDAPQERVAQARSCLVQGSPPVPSKLVKKIEAGDFIDMAELRPEGLGTMEDSAPGRSTKGKTKMISNILEWIRCFSLYVAILSRSAPHRVPDLLSYQALIIEAQMEYPGDHWLGYDRRFRQRAAVTKTTKWSKILYGTWHLLAAHL